TAVDAGSWEVTKKFGLPDVNLNNPHNMWTDRDQRLIYQTQWFSDKLTVFDLLTGRVLQNIALGEWPAHVEHAGATTPAHAALQRAIARGLLHGPCSCSVSTDATSTISCSSIRAPACHGGPSKVATKTVPLLAGYDPVTGHAPLDPGGSGALFIGGLPIQAPV